MVALTKDLAVIGVIIDKLLENENKYLDEENYPIISYEDVHQWGRRMEARTGYAVVQMFNRASLENYLHYLSFFQQKDKTFKLRLDHIAENQTLTRIHIHRIIARLLDKIDPAVNIPLDFLEAMHLLEILEDPRDYGYTE